MSIEVLKSDGKWRVKVHETIVRQGTSIPIKTTINSYRLKRDAKIAGTALARYLKTEIVIKDRKGIIREKNSFGNDPEEIKG